MDHRTLGIQTMTLDILSPKQQIVNHPVQEDNMKIFYFRITNKSEQASEDTHPLT